MSLAGDPLPPILERHGRRSEPAIFNQDGFADILLQNKNTGAVSVWEMNNNTLSAGALSPIPGRVGTRSEPAPTAPTFSFKHERPSLGLGDERKHHRRRWARWPKPRAELASGGADLTARAPTIAG
jgi:hypothetical protein